MIITLESLLNLYLLSFTKKKEKLFVKRMKEYYMKELSRVIYIEQQIDALNFAFHDVYEDYPRQVPDEVTKSKHVLFSHLYQKLNDAYKNLLMYSGFIGGKHFEQAKRLAFEKYCQSDAIRRKYNFTNFKYPCKWSDKEETDYFSKLSQELINERVSKDCEDKKPHITKEVKELLKDENMITNEEEKEIKCIDDKKDKK